MEPSPSKKVTSHLGTHEISNILQNLEVYYHVDMNQPLVSILGQMNPGHTTKSYLSDPF
jgi:hypothetical protein